MINKSLKKIKSSNKCFYWGLHKPVGFFFKIMYCILSILRGSHDCIKIIVIDPLIAIQHVLFSLKHFVLQRSLIHCRYYH